MDKEKKSIGLTILIWVETILSIRVLLFTAPLLISKMVKGGVQTQNTSDWTIVVITMIALYYFLTGIASIVGHKAWKFFHYLGAVLTCAMIAGLVNRISSVEVKVNPFFAMPIILSIIMAVVVARAKVLQPAQESK